MQKFGNFSRVYTLAHRFTSVVSNIVEIGTGYVSERPHGIGDRKKQNTFWWHLAQFFVRVCTVVPHLYSRFHPNLFRFGGVITEKPASPQSDFKFNTGSLSL